MAATTHKRASKKTTAKSSSQTRAKPGTTGHGEYYHIQIRPKTGFTSFRTQDVGKKGGIQRVAGHRQDGSWETQQWLISKDMAHLEGGRLVADRQAARKVLDDLGSAPKHVAGDRFRAKPEAASAR